jgi:aminopeptidase S
MTSIISPRFRLGERRWRLSFRYTFAHDARSTTADFLRVSVVSGGRRTVVWQQRGGPFTRGAAWTRASADLSAFAGQRIRLVIEAADGGRANLVEAAIDDIRAFRAP